jgi:hypothetical protein
VTCPTIDAQGRIAEDIRLSVELKEKVSSDSGRHDVVLRLPLDGIPFYFKYHTVCAGVCRVIAISRSRKGQGWGEEAL